MDKSLAEGVWALLETSRNDGVTLEDIEIMMKSAEQSLCYMEALIKRDYVTMCGIKHDSGSAIAPKFKLLKFTGPQAPYVNDKGTFIDPNLKAPKGGPTKVIEDEKPRTSAVIVVAAQKLGGPFDKHQIVEATGLHTKAPFITSYLRNLVTRGWLKRIDKAHWQFNETPPDIDYMLNILKAGAGKEPISMYSARQGYSGLLEPSAQGFAVDVLKASGWKITRLYSEGPYTKTLYQVEKP